MLSIQMALDVHHELRDHVAEAIHGVHEKQLEPLFATVLIQSFTHCFNTYKAIGLLLPDLYYESGCALLRIAWETSLNLAWVAVRPQERARAFMQFTVVETHRFYETRALECDALQDKAQAAAVRASLDEFDKTFASVLDEYRSTDKARRKLSQRFSSVSLDKLAAELGLPWSAEYRGIYPLLCSYAHGSPGVVIFPKPFVDDFSELAPKAMASTEEPRTAKLALWSMCVLERSYRAVLDAFELDDTKFLDDLDRRVGFRQSLKRAAQIRAV